MLQVLSNRRAVTDEIMDSPDVEEAAHLQALDGLRRINRFSQTASQLRGPIMELTKRTGLRRISLLDIACGGGDVPIEVALGMQRCGIEVNLTLLDKSATAVQRASAAATRAGIACVGVRADVLDDLPAIKADVVTNSLFLHHLREPAQVVEMLRRMSAMAGRLVVISDLVRSRAGVVAAWAACRLLSSSKIVHHDGPASVRAAWTPAEMTDFAAQAGMTGARVDRCMPLRMLLVWGKPQETAG
jgi:2-polyprenyl-3-methyl-5-hydroxy-6-metoxy-1,4-benzoquinol methylase